MEPLEIHPATPDRWSDVLDLFGENGAYSNCWCTWWLLSSREWSDAAPDERRHVLQTKVSGGSQPGLLAYRDGDAVGWCAVGPRDWYARMNSPRARVYKRIDDAPTWVVNCFFIRRDQRGSGIATALLAAAVDHAAGHGAAIIEGYPKDRDANPGAAADLFVGTLSMFRAAGFAEATRVGNRPLVRKYLDEPH